MQSNSNTKSSTLVPPLAHLPQPTSLMDQAKQLYHQKHYAQALQQFVACSQAKAQQSPRNTRHDYVDNFNMECICLKYMAKCYMRMGKYSDAITALDMLIQSDTTNATVLYKRAKCNYLIGKKQDAFKDLQMALIHLPSDDQHTKLAVQALAHKIDAELNSLQHHQHHNVGRMSNVTSPLMLALILLCTVLAILYGRTFLTNKYNK